MMRLSNFPIITYRRLKVGVVGCGRISKKHFGSILQYPEELELAAVCGIDGIALKQMVTEFNVQGYAQFFNTTTAPYCFLVTIFNEFQNLDKGFLSADMLWF